MVTDKTYGFLDFIKRVFQCLKVLAQPLSTCNIHKNLPKDSTLTNASRSVSCLYLTVLDLFDFGVVRIDILRFSYILMYIIKSESILLFCVIS